MASKPTPMVSIDLFKLPGLGALLKKIFGGFPPDKPKTNITQEEKKS